MTILHMTEGEEYTYVDSDENQIAEIDFDERRFELGGYNFAGNGALLILRDGHGREVIRLNVETGNITVGGLNPESEQDGDIIVKDKIGREVIRLDAGGASISVGSGDGLNAGDIVVKEKSGNVVIQLKADTSTVLVGGENPHDVDGALKIRDHEGEPVIRLIGEDRTLTIGGKGKPGRLLIRNADGKATAGLHGGHNALLLRSPNGSLFRVTVSDNGSLETRAV